MRDRSVSEDRKQAAKRTLDPLPGAAGPDRKTLETAPRTASGGLPPGEGTMSRPRPRLPKTWQEVIAGEQQPNKAPPH